jgi:hypothetical protein
MEGAIFLTALHDAAEKEGEKVARICLGCHAPLAAQIGDTKLENRLSWEGVGCDVCHSVASVDTSGANPKMVFDLGGTKRGPIRDAESNAHGVEYSEIHAGSLICIGCHEYAAGDGTPILSTYSEWQKSAAAARGESCQDCHMGRTEANVVDPSVKRTAGTPVNLHEVPGGHSLNMLNRAIHVSMKPERRGEELRVEVRINNKGAGHAVPTGMPGRRLILTVSVKTTQNQSFEEKRIYTKSFVDAEGNPIEHDGECFAEGARLLSDTRLMSDEQRVESFRFHVPTSAGVSIKTRVQYEHSPTGRPEDSTRLTVLSEDRSLKPAAGPER